MEKEESIETDERDEKAAADPEPKKQDPGAGRHRQQLLGHRRALGRARAHRHRLRPDRSQPGGSVRLPPSWTVTTEAKSRLFGTRTVSSAPVRSTVTAVSIETISPRSSPTLIV